MFAVTDVVHKEDAYVKAMYVWPSACLNWSTAGFEVLILVPMKSSVVWVITPCVPVDTDVEM